MGKCLTVMGKSLTIRQTVTYVSWVSV